MRQIDLPTFNLLLFLSLTLVFLPDMLELSFLGVFIWSAHLLWVQGLSALVSLRVLRVLSQLVLGLRTIRLTNVQTPLVIFGDFLTPDLALSYRSVSWVNFLVTILVFLAVNAESHIILVLVHCEVLTVWDYRRQVSSLIDLFVKSVL